MSVPTHSEDCRTQTWATRCRDCGDPVFFFSCTCGSRVLFDRLGDPWPLHQDRCIPHWINVLRAGGLSAAHLMQIVEQEAERRNVVVPDAIWSRLRKDEYAETGRPLTVSVEPGGSEQQLIGDIIRADLQVNFYKRLKYPKNDFSTAFLGKLVKSSYVELLVREDPDRVTGLCVEAACFLELSQYRARALHLRDRISVYLVSHEMPDGKWVWLVDHVVKV